MLRAASGLSPIVDEAAPFGEAQEERGKEGESREDEDLDAARREAHARPASSTQCPAAPAWHPAGSAASAHSRRRRQPLASVTKIAGTSA